MVSEYAPSLKAHERDASPVHVAKQVLAASLWYHAIFQRSPEQLLQQISRQLTRYVASAQHHSQGDAAIALAQGNSQDSAALPASAPSVAVTTSLARNRTTDLDRERTTT
ncbi:hypothetical protein ABBQ32_006029 [Trebouxia sp. C0010 RCD-2024]